MSQIGGHLLLGAAVLVGSAIPFVPTGEMVSGAAAYAAHSELNVLAIFGVTWIASVLGDTVMLTGSRFFAARVGPWIGRRRFGARVTTAQDALTRNAFNAIVTGRLIPGGRAPVIIALGLSRFPVRRFVLYDLVACGLWAGIYSSLGSIGGRIANHPVWAMVIAIAFAVSVGALVQEITKLVHWWRQRSRQARGGPRVVADLADQPAPEHHGATAMLGLVNESRDRSDHGQRRAAPSARGRRPPTA